MGKEGDLWDDSALINAFDHAISNYKKIHSKKSQDHSPDGEKVTSTTEENTVSNVIDEGHQAIRHGEAKGNGNVVSNTETEKGDAKNLAPVKENHILNSHEPEPYVDSSNGLLMQDALQGNSYSQGAEDYNQLLSQYYELEEKREKILQQLHKFDNWNYQYAGEGSSSAGVQWGTCSTSQAHPVPASQACYPAYPCCPYVCQCMVAPCTSFPGCSSGGPCVGETCTDTNVAITTGNSRSLVDGDIVKTAMGAAERAISSIKSETFVNSDITEEKEKKKDTEGEMAQGVSSETDLTVVLNAWYSAGFHTGKYLTEQSIAKKRHS